MRSRSASPWTASWRRAASSDAKSSELGSSIDSLTARATASTSMRPSRATWSMADWVRLPTILWVEESRASAPKLQGRRGERRMEPEMRAPGPVHDQGRPRRVGHAGQFSTSAAIP